MKILAHRGGMGRAPENSMIGFKRALEDGADGFECDAMFTRDKEPVIMHVPFHSSSIHRQTGKRIYLDQINWKDLSGIKALGEPIVHLNELLEFVSNNKAICASRWVEPPCPSLLAVATGLPSNSTVAVKHSVSSLAKSATLRVLRRMRCWSMVMGPPERMAWATGTAWERRRRRTIWGGTKEGISARGGRMMPS